MRRILLENISKAPLISGGAFCSLATRATPSWLRAPKPACHPRLGHASHLQALSPSDWRHCPWRPEAASTDLSEGRKGAISLPLHPKSITRLCFQRQEARLGEKVRGGVEGGGRKSLNQGGLVGRFPATTQSEPGEGRIGEIILG